MKKLLATLILTALALSPLTAFAVPIEDSLAGNQTDQKNAAITAVQSQIDALTQQGQVAGCSSNGNFGGSLSTAVGTAAAGALSSQLQKVFGQIGAKAGPFAPVMNALGNIISNKVQGLLSNGAQQLASNLFGSDAVSSGAAGLAGDIGRAGAPGANAVPVNEQGTVKTDTTSIRGTSERDAKANEAVTYKECVSDPLVAKIRNAIVAMLTKSTVDWINNGFEGGPAFATALRGTLNDIAQTALKDVIDNQTGGICSTRRDEIKTIVLTQYQYSDNFGQQVQCRNESQSAGLSSGDWKASGGWQGWHDLFVTCGLSGCDYISTTDQVNTQVEAARQQQLIELGWADGFFSKKKCTDDGSSADKTACVNGQIIVPGTLIRDTASTAFQQPNQQLVNADEIGELIDALMSSLSEVAFQGLDGLAGVSNKSKSGNGSYLDNLVGGTSDNSIGTAQDTLLTDADGVMQIEQQYQDILQQILDNLNETKQDYQDVAACYVKLNSTLSTKISSSDSTARANLASSTIAQYLTPQITAIQQQLTTSQNGLDQLDIIISNIQSAQTVDELATATAAYNSLVASGMVHTATDLTYLQNDLAAGAIALQVLNTDARDKLNECRAY